MKKFYLILSLMLMVTASTTWAAKYPLGNALVNGDVLDYYPDMVTAKGNASVVSNLNAPLKPGETRLESLKASEIKVELTHDKKGNISGKHAIATGGVTIKAKRLENDTDENGKPITVLKDLNATAKTAELDADKNTILLTGSVLIKVTKPGSSAPELTANGERFEVDLKTSHIRSIGQPGSQAGISFQPKGGTKK